MSYVIIIDDDPGILRLLKTGLRKAGFEVAAFENAADALSMIKMRKPDIIITDAMMPDKDGYELARELRNMPETRALPIIMLTALQQEQDALKAFRDGVDDFVTKPFSMPVLRARITALLNRSMPFIDETAAVTAKIIEKPPPATRVSTGVPNLDVALDGGIPPGSNILFIGDTGSGKSTLARQFVTAGMLSGERCMVITLDDDPAMIREILGEMLGKNSLIQYEQESMFRMVDCFSWNRGVVKSDEKFAISGMMDLNQLAAIISDAGLELGQTITDKSGGRRIIDSVSSLFINFELVLVQRFLAQLARTASSYGGVSSIFIVEEGSINEREINNVKYLMDVVIELKIQDAHMARVANMKWSKFSREWVTLE